MARKANISKEEIIEACWKLIEQNVFPNIPRLSGYFRELDGRGCSNTTLLNGITEWEEAYREHQESELADLNDTLTTSFKRFQRDATQALSILLDEKIQAHEAQLQLRKQALEGRNDSLSHAYIDADQRAQEASEAYQLSHTAHQTLQLEHNNLQQRYDDVLAHHRVLEAELAESDKKRHEAEVKLNQAQVDLAKQDQTINMLNDALKSAQQQLSAEKTRSDAQYEQMLSSTLDELKNLTQSLQSKKAD